MDDQAIPSSTSRDIASPEYTPAQQRALLSWVNSSFDLTRKVNGTIAFTNGHLLAEMLHELDPEYDPTSLVQSSGTPATLTGTNNIKTVLRAFSKYLDTDGNVDSLKSLIDFRPLSGDIDANAICRLLSLFAYAAVGGKHTTKYIKAMTTRMSPEDVNELKDLMTHISKEVPDPDDTTSPAQSPQIAPEPTLDRELEYEAEVSKLKKELALLKKTAADNLTARNRLQEAYDETKYKLGNTQDALTEAQKSQGEQADAHRYRKLDENKVHELEKLIAEQEGQIQDLTSARDALRRENADLAEKAERVKDMTDEVRLLKRDVDGLTKKANAGERYKSKLEEQKKAMKELDAALDRATEADKLQIENEALQVQLQKEKAINDIFREWQEKVEVNIHDAKLEKDIITKQLYAVSKEKAELQSKLTIYQDRTQELEDQVLGRRASISPSGSERNFNSSNLEQELEGSVDPNAVLHLEISKLRAENNLMRNNLGAGSEEGRLIADLELAKRKEELLQKKYNDVFEKHTIAQEQIQALMDGMTGERDQAFFKLRTTLLETDYNLGEERKKVAELEAKNADMDRDLLALRTDKNAYTKESIDALEELKSTDQLISGSLKSELDATRKRCQALMIEVDQQKGELLEVYKSNGQLRQQHEKSAAAEPSSPVVQELQSSEQVDELVRQSNEKVKRVYQKYQKIKEQLEAKDQERYELQKRLKAAEAGDAYAAQKAANEQIIKNLQRENAMISTAWYDLTSRIQSNHVVLQRRQDMPKSWLNKQRQMVMNATPRK